MYDDEKDILAPILKHKPDAVERTTEDMRYMLALEDTQRKQLQESIQRAQDIRDRHELQAKQQSAKEMLMKRVREGTIDIMALKFAVEEVIAEMTQPPPMTPQQKLEEMAMTAVGKGMAEGKIPKDLLDPKYFKK